MRRDGLSWTFLFSLIALCLTAMPACSGGSSQDDETGADGAVAVVDAQSPADTGTPSLPDVGVVNVGCLADSECGDTELCVNDATCVDGACVYGLAETGSPCIEGCLTGTCSAKGECTNTHIRECPEVDGNLCTVPTCDPDTSECLEEPMPDGASPYAETDCWTGAVCQDGEVDSTDAIASELAETCDALSAQLEPADCIDHYACVGAEIGCQAVVKPDGVECWVSDGGDSETCAGYACNGGECAPDSALSFTCDANELSVDCDDGCVACTELTCHWIPDPSSPADEPGMMPYCKPTASIETPCIVAESCAVNQVCGLGASADGPLGKETLGACGGGIEKTTEQCAAELGKDPLKCVLKGVFCDPLLGGCYWAQNTADGSCQPPDWLCFDPNETYCTHLDTGEGWDPETGCHTSWIDLDCDDSNPCTVDVCKTDGASWDCEHQPVNGAACDDGDPCTIGGLCDQGECAGHVSKCDDGDGNPCNDELCDQETLECNPGDTTGVACDDGNPCTYLTQCATNVCTGGSPKICNDGNPCTDDYCDPLSDCATMNNAASCSDGDPCTDADTCVDGACVGGLPTICDDGEPCTDDDCSAAEGGCFTTPNTAPCDDENPCTSGDVCANGSCEGPLPVSCTDFNTCTEDLCYPATGCSNTPVAGLACNGGGPWSCDATGECVCAAECTAGTCGDDGCGGTCNCPAGQVCTSGVCQSGAGGDYDGLWSVTEDQTSPMYQGGMLPMTMDMTFEATTVSAQGTVSILPNPIAYTGPYDHPDFTLTANYSDGTFNHSETWTCTLESPTKFTGTLVETISLLGSPFGSYMYPIVGIKQ